ncbi:hypothetical protein CAEBREN_19678 [Caenorhabditis brenneri]|uniref:Uncharacterized protein n=1 Tax=Caenorhabditis brenneri TaxID=135651 RepID=G0NVG6_CAEBE|nr:hypothetical protein CAEBREN_19678 [Caenorhabditis brenneri]
MSPLISSLAFCIFLFVANVEAQKTYFQFKGVFICPKNFLWREIRLIEDDGSPSKNEEVSEWFSSYSFAPHKFEIKGEDYDDNGDYFEIQLLIRHTCTDDGRTLQYRYDVGEFEESWIVSTTHTRDLEIDILNKGDESFTDL